MKTRVSTILAASLLSLGGGAAAAAGVLADTEPQSFQPINRTTHYYAAGPSADYRRWQKPYPHANTAFGEVDPALVKTPAEAAAYQAVVELSFTYHTRGDGPFYVRVVVDTGAGGGDDGTADDLATRPATPIRLAPTTKTSTTVRVLVPTLEADTSYRVMTRVQSVTPKPAGRNHINLQSAIMTVDITPSAWRNRESR